MRSAAAAVVATVAAAAVLGACGGHARPTLPAAPSPAVPAADLAFARDGAVRVDASQGGLAAKDPRVVDLDIIRIQATPKGIGGEPELTSVSSAEMFRQATDAAKSGQHNQAISTYRQLASEFPTSQYAPVSLFNIAAVFDKQGDLPATITVLRELVAAYPSARESIEGHLYIAALQSEKAMWPDALATLDAVLLRTNLMLADRVEAHARRGYVLLEQQRHDDAEAALAAAVADWRRAPRIEDPYYIAMAHYYRGEVAHRRFAASPIRLPDDQLAKDLEARRVLAGRAYDHWKESLHHRHAYWATAAGYQMSQIFVELWEVTVKAPYPPKLDPAQRGRYVSEIHERVRVHLEKALEGHKMNIELARAYGVDTDWSRSSEQRAVQVLDLLARDARGDYVTPAP